MHTPHSTTENNERYLIITNAYPHPLQLYRNGFIHRRVKAYQEQGLQVDVFVLHPTYKEKETYNFEGVHVTRGTEENLCHLLKEKQFIKYMIHFVSPEMIQAIKNSGNKDVPILLWIHGFEAEAWHRRWFNFLANKNELQRVLNMTDTYYRDQQQLLNYLFKTKEMKIETIHVSEWFKTHVVEVDARATSQNSHIIPNVIDDTLFNYVEKPVEQRMHILSIRPYASRKYANDLSVKAVLELSKRPIFKHFTFSFFGEGALFKETLKPLKKFENVHIENRFLNQAEIAALHKENGIFLCPTRWDSQGVSMCEAMASGLVPISNNITAIPEFVTNNESGILAAPDDYMEMADAMERLYYFPEMFQNISQNAASSIRHKCGKDRITAREVRLIKGESYIG